MLRALVALIAVAAVGFAQERTWKEAQEESWRLQSQGKIEEAVAAMAEASRLAAAADPKDRATIEFHLSRMLRLVCRNEEAETHGRQAVELFESAVPALDRTLATARVMLAQLEVMNGRLDQAELDACTAFEAAQGEAPEIEVGCLATLVRASFGRGEYAVALELMKLAIARVREAEPGALSYGLARAALGLTMAIGRYDLAEQTLAEMNQMSARTQLNPADALDVARLATTLWIKQRRLGDAERMASEALEKSAPVSGGIPIPVAEVTVALARVALEQNDLERAAECIARAEPALRRPGYDTGSELASLLDARAELRRRRGDRKAARTDLEEALRLRSRDGERGLGAARTLLALAQLESEDGAHDRSIDYAARATRLYLRAIGPTAEGRDACDAYERLRAKGLDAGLKDAPVLRGMRLGENLEPDAAETDAKVRQLADRAQELVSLQDLGGGLSQLDEAIKLRPGDPMLFGMRARLLQDLGRWEEALAAVDEQISWSLKPDHSLYWTRAGLCLRLRRHDRVIVDVTYAMLLGEGDPALPRLRGISRLGRGEAELGLRSLEACVKIEPNDSMAVYLQGIALWSLERFDEAEPVLRTAIEKGVQRATAYAKLAWIERCRGNIELAQAEVARSLEADPKQLGAHGVLCFIHVDRGEWKAALVDYEAWSGDEPPSLYDRLFQWICRAHVGEREAATEALRSAIEGEKDRTDLVAVARAILGEGPAPSPEGNAPPDREERKRMCEAHFLLGMWREVEGDAAGARAHHQRVLAMNRTDLLLIQSARVALARLDGAK